MTRRVRLVCAQASSVGLRYVCGYPCVQVSVSISVGTRLSERVMQAVCPQEAELGTYLPSYFMHVLK